MSCQKSRAVITVVHVILVRNGNQLALRHGIRKIPVILYSALSLPYEDLQAVFPGQSVNIAAGSGRADNDVGRDGLGLKRADALLQIR